MPPLNRPGPGRFNTAKNLVRELRSLGSVRGEGGSLLVYSENPILSSLDLMICTFTKTKVWMRRGKPGGVGWAAQAVKEGAMPEFIVAPPLPRVDRVEEAAPR